MVRRCRHPRVRAGAIAIIEGGVVSDVAVGLCSIVLAVDADQTVPGVVDVGVGGLAGARSRHCRCVKSHEGSRASVPRTPPLL